MRACPESIRIRVKLREKIHFLRCFLKKYVISTTLGGEIYGDVSCLAIDISSFLVDMTI